ncbi:hypothetical protein PG995_005887 [Apiospora arundinis]
MVWCSHLEPDVQSALLPREPAVGDAPLRFRVSQLDAVTDSQRRDYLVRLQQRKVLANADARTRAKRQVCRVHRCEPRLVVRVGLFASLQPALGQERVGVIAIDGGVARYYTRVDAYDGAGGDEQALCFCAFLVGGSGAIFRRWNTSPPSGTYRSRFIATPGSMGIASRITASRYGLDRASCQFTGLVLSFTIESSSCRRLCWQSVSRLLTID